MALLLPRSEQVVVAMLGALACGAAYAPLDPTYPPARIADTLADCAPAAVVTTRELAGEFALASEDCVFLDEDDERAPPPPDVAIDGADPAYIIYTSGSTGRAKGVVVTHANLLHATAARFSVYEQPPETYLLLSSFAFDSSVAGTYWTLAAGGHLVISEPGLEQEPERLAAVVERRGVTHTLCLPSLYEAILESAPRRRLQSLTTVIVAGEAAPGALLARHRAALPGATLFNEYGPTEATVWCTLCDTTWRDAGAPVPIGRPIPGADIRLLAPDERLAPLGAAGELWVGGPGVAQGYLGEEELTREAFRAPDYEGGGGARMYRTGDLARYGADGALEFLGRADGQVKIRGQRVEIDEVEAVLRAHEEVREAAVIAETAHDRGARLAAFVTARSDLRPPEPDALRTHLLTRLPAYMAPARITRLDAMPRLPNGKADRAALARRASDSASEPGQAPRNDFERTLAEVWAEVLKRDAVGRRDNYFVLGGDSIASIKIVALAAKRGVSLTPSEVYEYPTIAELNDLRQGGAGDRFTRAGMAMRLAECGPGRHAPLFMVHGGRRLLARLASLLEDERAVHLLLDHWDSGDIDPFATSPSLARDYLQVMRELQPAPPYYIGGYSVGAPIAFEMARQLKAAGEPPAL
ncbi:MAG: amino acid adenylation domain-containing protein, partial [Caulobacterales bacterium]|nr:amino acid adenylation domain-containing protein [Caulobacterales bacterium]